MSETKQSDVYSIEQTKKGNGSTAITLKGDAVPKGKVLQLSLLAISWDSVENLTVKFGYERGGTEFYITKRVMYSADATHGTYQSHDILEAELTLAENERPIVNISSAATSTTISFYGRGILK